MALIKCRECGKEISDSALACPHCGCKTHYAEKSEKAKEAKHTVMAINLVYTALWIIGSILFLCGYAVLSDYGYGLFDNWAQSYSDSVVAAGRNCVIGILLIAIGVIGSILFMKNRHQFEAHLKSSGASSEPVSTKRCCPHCGNVVTSNVCDMCGKKILIPLQTESPPGNGYSRSQIMNNVSALSGKCDLCDTQGPTSLCKIPDLPGEYELCKDCMNQYMAQADNSPQ